MDTSNRRPHEIPFAWAPLDAAYGLIAVHGDDARAFLHGQLTSDVAGLDPRHARRAGWCSAKGRLLANFLVIPHGDAFLLQLSRDLVPPVLRRLAMFVLRAKVRLTDASAQWSQLGLWGSEAQARIDPALAGPQEPLGCADIDGAAAVAMGTDRFLLLVPADRRAAFESRYGAAGATDEWARREIRAGHPLITAATQDLFVPQMVNLERIGGVDFRKGCYPGQEVVARTQYRGQLKRRMVLATVSGDVPVAPGQELFCDDLPGQAGGNVVNVAPSPTGRDLLAVVSLSALEGGAAIRVAPGGPALELLSLPYPL